MISHKDYHQYYPHAFAIPFIGKLKQIKYLYGLSPLDFILIEWQANSVRAQGSIVTGVGIVEKEFFVA